MLTWRDGRRNKREGCERQVCHRVTCKDYERKECIHGGKERVRNSIILPTLTYGSETWTWNTAVKSACCGNELSEKSMSHDNMGN